MVETTGLLCPVGLFAVDLIGYAYAFEVDSGLFDSGVRFEEYVREALGRCIADVAAA